MPLYEYRCTACSYQFEQRRSFGDYATCCPECGGEVQQVFGTFRFRFRGRNWKPYSAESAAKGESIKEEIVYG